MNLYLIGGVLILVLTIFLLIYKLGKNAKAQEIINNNAELKKKYENNKNHINNSDSLSDKLQKGNY